MPEITYINQDAITVVGIATKVNLMTNDIADTVRKYFSEVNTKIPHSINPNITYGIYTNYKNDITGKHSEYTYLIGEKVNSTNDISPELTNIILPEQNYVKFSATQHNVSDVWKNILTTNELNRSYIADFEVYDTENMTL